MTHTLWVPGEPVPQPRQKQGSIPPSRFDIGQHLPGKRVMMNDEWVTMTLESFRKWLITNTISTNYTPKDHAVKPWKQAIQLEWINRYSRFPSVEWTPDDALGMSLTFISKRPKTMSFGGKSKVITYARRPNPRLWDRRLVGDFDNLAKAVCDALSGVAYKDDCQIATGVVERFIAEPKEPTGVIIKIWKLDPATATGPLERPKTTKAPF